jgi:hypothetical protein
LSGTQYETIRDHRAHRSTRYRCIQQEALRAPCARGKTLPQQEGDRCEQDPDQVGGIHRAAKLRQARARDESQGNHFVPCTRPTRGARGRRHEDAVFRPRYLPPASCFDCSRRSCASRRDCAGQESRMSWLGKEDAGQRILLYGTKVQ